MSGTDGLTCEVCQRRYEKGGEVDTYHVDVSQGFGEPAGRVWFAINHCRGVRCCREGAEKQANEFAAKWKITV